MKNLSLFTIMLLQTHMLLFASVEHKRRYF